MAMCRNLNDIYLQYTYLSLTSIKQGLRKRIPTINLSSNSNTSRVKTIQFWIFHLRTPVPDLVGLIDIMATMTTIQTEIVPTVPEKTSLVQQIHQIDDDQEVILTKFKKVLESRALYTSAIQTTKASHLDCDLMYTCSNLSSCVFRWLSLPYSRFLKARKWDIKGAAQQFEFVETWRKTNRIDELYENFDVEEFETARKYVCWLHLSPDKFSKKGGKTGS